MLQTRFEVPGKPVPASRPKVSKFGTYYPKAHTMHSEYLRKYLMEVPAFPVADPVEVRILNVMQPYATSDHPVHRADVDNLAKLPLDMMTKSVDTEGVQRFWTDDNLIVNLVTLKRFAREGEEPHTKVRIINIGRDYADYVDQRFEA